MKKFLMCRMHLFDFCLIASQGFDWPSGKSPFLAPNNDVTTGMLATLFISASLYIFCYPNRFLLFTLMIDYLHFL